MLKKFVSLFMAATMVLGTTSISFAADIQFDDETVMETEYEMILKQSQEYNLYGRNADGIDPLEEYQKGFSERALLPEEVLEGYGYTNEEIQVLKDFSEGDISFEEAATRASAVLSSRLTCRGHKADEYHFEYYWWWDKVPVDMYEDCYVIAVQAFDSNGLNIGTKTLSKSGSISYYTPQNEYSTSKKASVQAETQGVSCNVDVQLLNYDSTWVWAKEGSVQLKVAPVVSTTSFEAVRARGEYAHATVERTIGVSVSIPLSISFSLAQSGTKVRGVGIAQIIYYIDGSHVNET